MKTRIGISYSIIVAVSILTTVLPGVAQARGPRRSEPLDMGGRIGALGSRPRHLTDVGGILFFTADDGIHGRELWKSDGTAAGTVIVSDIGPEQRRDVDQVLRRDGLGHRRNQACCITGVGVIRRSEGRRSFEG